MKKSAKHTHTHTHTHTETLTEAAHTHTDTKHTNTHTHTQCACGGFCAPAERQVTSVSPVVLCSRQQTFKGLSAAERGRASTAIYIRGG